MRSHIGPDASVRHHLAPLMAFLERPGVTEVCVNRPGEVFYEANSSWRREDVDLDYHWLESLGVAVATYCNNAFDDTSPILSAELPGKERIQFVRPPACEGETIAVTIRKPSDVIRELSQYEAEGCFDHVEAAVDGLTRNEFALQELLDARKYGEFLRLAIALGKNIVIAGATGSGKTTFMKGLMQLIPRDERLITIEDVRELFLPHHPNHVHLFYPAEAPKEGAIVTPAKLLRCCMRMKPDRILLAELRGAEAFDFVDICESGHGGVITSMHAGSAAQAFDRLVKMVLKNSEGQHLPHNVIRNMLYSVIDIVVHFENDTKGGKGRHITEIWYEPMKKREIT